MAWEPILMHQRLLFRSGSQVPHQQRKEKTKTTLSFTSKARALELLLFDTVFDSPSVPPGEHVAPLPLGSEPGAERRWVDLTHLFPPISLESEPGERWVGFTWLLPPIHLLLPPLPLGSELLSVRECTGGLNHWDQRWQGPAEFPPPQCPLSRIRMIGI